MISRYSTRETREFMFSNTVHWQNPFFIVRFVAFALLVALNLLILVLAAWNVKASVAARQSVPATGILLILESFAVFFCVTSGLVELVIPRINTAYVIVEFAWATILSIVQSGTIISLTLASPAICHLDAESELCATSSLMVPLGWLSSFILLSYFFSLFICTVIHIQVFPGLCVTSVYAVDWFGFRNAFQKTHKAEDDEIDSWTRYINDIEAARPHIEVGAKAPWARTIRRGIDAPFSGKRSSGRSTRQSLATRTTTIVTMTKTPPPALRPLLLPAALTTSLKSETGSRFLERFHDSARMSRSESVFELSKDDKSLSDSRASSPFPHSVDDHDLPIPLPRLSEWIRADAIKGINVHSIPSSP